MKIFQVAGTEVTTLEREPVDAREICRQDDHFMDRESADARVVENQKCAKAAKAKAAKAKADAEAQAKADAEAKAKADAAKAKA